MRKDRSKKTRPFINEGTSSSKVRINDKAARSLLRHKKETLPIPVWVQKIRDQDCIALSRAITTIESTQATHRATARRLIGACLPFAGKSIRIGITGSPGVGKSTFLETLGMYAIQQGKRVAVLAVDPSSQRSKGSILGDKTRMQSLSTHAQAFVRPSPAGTSLGGVAQRTREAIVLCEAAGYDIIFVETVGVGQSEIAVHSMVDVFVLLIAPGGGDELQGIKRGVVEMADIVIVNKADGTRTDLAKRTKQDYRNAIHLFPPKQSSWSPKVLTCSALHKEGISAVWEIIEAYFDFVKKHTFFDKNRKQQARYWLHETIEQQLKQHFYKNALVAQQWNNMEQAVVEGRLSPFEAAQQLFQLYSTQKEHNK